MNTVTIVGARAKYNVSMLSTTVTSTMWKSIRDRKTQAECFAENSLNALPGLCPIWWTGTIIANVSKFPVIVDQSISDSQQDQPLSLVKNVNPQQSSST